MTNRYISERVSDIDAYLDDCKARGLTPDPNIVCFGDYGAKRRCIGIRQGFHIYEVLHRKHIVNESIFHGFYHKVMYDRNGVNLLIYTKDEVICWDPIYRTILWSEPNANYPFEMPDPTNKNHWLLYFSSCVYGALLAHGYKVSDLKDIIGCTQNHAKKVNAGHADMTLKEMYIFTEHLGMSVDELLRH